MTETPKQLAKRLCEQIQKKGKDRGLLIAFEGPDGSGKTTQRKLFKDYKLDYPNSDTTKQSRKYVKAMKPLKVLFHPSIKSDISGNDPSGHGDE